MSAIETLNKFHKESVKELRNSKVVGQPMSSTTIKMITETNFDVSNRSEKEFYSIFYSD